MVFDPGFGMINQWMGTDFQLDVLTRSALPWWSF
jgi:hypothetical protein